VCLLQWAAIAFYVELPIESVFSSRIGIGRILIKSTNDSESALGTRKSGKGRRKLGRKKRRMRAKIRHRKK
jgi:hypothetical protein